MGSEATGMHAYEAVAFCKSLFFSLMGINNIFPWESDFVFGIHNILSRTSHLAYLCILSLYSVRL